MTTRIVRPSVLGAAVLMMLGSGAIDLGAQSAALGPGTDQYWYTGRQLRQPVVVELPADSEAGCIAQEVHFDAGDDGEVSPAVAQGRWRDGRCRAEGWWRLGETVGVQHLRARTGATETAMVVRAVARQGARIFFGGAWTPREDGWVELAEDDDGSPYLKQNDPSGIFRPVVGVDFPIWPSWRRVRMGVGASARDIDRFFYVGLSALQSLVFGPGQEGSAVDVHVGLQFARRDIGMTGSTCAPVAYCTRRDLRFGGLTFMVTVDGASAFKGLAGSVLR